MQSKTKKTKTRKTEKGKSLYSAFFYLNGKFILSHDILQF